MAERTVRYTAEFKRQMVGLVRSGRTAARLPSALRIANTVEVLKAAPALAQETRELAIVDWES